MLCVIFKVRQWVNTAPAVRIAVIIYQLAFLLFHAAAMYVQSVILIFAITAPTTASARKYGESGEFMKLMNFEARTLIMQNIRTTEKQPVPEHFSKSQYQILRNLILRKKIEKRFFDFLLSELYDLSDWHKLTYAQMYETIFILAHYDFRKGEEKNGEEDFR